MTSKIRIFTLVAEPWIDFDWFIFCFICSRWLATILEQILVFGLKGVFTSMPLVSTKEQGATNVIKIATRC